MGHDPLSLRWPMKGFDLSWRYEVNLTALLCENGRLWFLSKVAQKTSGEQTQFCLGISTTDPTQNLPSCPLQILKLAWPPLLKICKAPLNILYEGACRVGLEIQLNSCLIYLAKKKKKSKHHQTKQKWEHIQYLNTAACHISPEGGKISPIPLPQATPIKHIFSFPIAVILSCTDERVGL